MTRTVPLRILLVTAAALTVSAGPGSAQSVRSFSLSADNDGFVFWIPPHRRPDRYYTSGLRLEALVSWTPVWAGLLTSGEPTACGLEEGPEPCFLTRLTLGHRIYTPDFVFDSNPSTHDRPYAGWLYVEANTEKVGSDRLTSLSLQLGVTGGLSFAGPIHRWFHRSLGKHEPIGWEHQIPFEPAFQVRYEVRRTFPVDGGRSPAFLHLEPRGKATVGTVRSGLSAGLTAAAGWNVASSQGWRTNGHRAPFLVLSLGMEGEMVLRDLFLDGSTWARSLSADRETWVGRVRGGIQLGVGRIGVKFEAARSTLEFRRQNGHHTYGTFELIFFS